MSSKPIFYNWDDVGSPGRNLTGNHQNRLKQILKSCLVDGYGDKPGAGWTIGHEHPNGFSLVNGRGDFVVNFVSNLSGMSSFHVHVYTANSITDASDAIIVGTNLCSGPYRKELDNSNDRHTIYSLDYILSNELNSLYWTVLADCNTFIISCSVSNSSPDNGNTTGPKNHSLLMYFGDMKDSLLDNVPIALGGNMLTYTGSDRGRGNQGLWSGYSAPVNPFNGLSESTVLGAFPYTMYNTVLPGASIQLLSNMNLISPSVVAGANVVGRLKGVLFDPLITHTCGWSVYLTCLGLEPVFSNRNKIATIQGSNYCFARHVSSSGSFLTDNPDFW